MRFAFIKKRFSTYGGAERYLQTLIQQLKDSDHEIHVFANQWTEEKGITFHKVNIIPFTSFLSTLTFDRNLRLKIRGLEFDCIISFERTTSHDIYRAGEGCHAEWLNIRSEIEPFYKNISFKINPLHITLIQLEKKIFKNSGLIIANSKMVKEQIIKHYKVPENKIATIYNGVDLTRFSPDNKEKWRNDIRNSLNIPKDSKVLLFVGSGFERKGLKTLMHAIPSINKDVKVIIVGKGNTKKYKALTEKLGVSKSVVFLGIQNNLEKLYAASDLFVLPTLYDPFSNATIEAMASGIPVITTKNNGVAELIENGHEGFVMESLFDARELAQKINLSLENHQHMGEMARKKAEEFSIEKAVEEFINAIKGSFKLK